MLVLFISIAVTVLDQVTKDWVTGCFAPGEGVPVLPGFFNFVYVRNTGAAWGMFGGLTGWLAVFSILMLVTIVLFRRSFLNDTLAHRIALGCMVGGIVGNLIDRLRLQYVVDFLDFHAGVHHFPAFNIADSAICVGVGLYMVTAFLTSEHPLRDIGNNEHSDKSG